MSPIPDDRLRLIFTCCHPALAMEAPGRADPAHARRPHDPRDRAGVPRPGADAGPAPGPGQAQDPRRRHPVPRPAGRAPARAARRRPARPLPRLQRGLRRDRRGDALIRRELCAEAIRLARVVVALLPDEPEATGLLALMLLHDARREARVGDGGDLVLLEDQDRSRWDRARDRRGRGPRRRGPCAAGRPGPYQVQAAIAALHDEAATPGRHRLGADRRALPRAAADDPVAGRRAQPGRRGRDGGRAGDRARDDGRAGGDRRPRRPTRTCTRRGPTCSAGSGAGPRPPRPTAARSR